jgi:hypothetical protein
MGNRYETELWDEEDEGHESLYDEWESALEDDEENGNSWNDWMDEVELDCGAICEIERDSWFDDVQWRFLNWWRSRVIDTCYVCGKIDTLFGREVGDHEKCNEIPF